MKNYSDIQSHNFWGTPVQKEIDELKAEVLGMTDVDVNIYLHEQGITPCDRNYLKHLGIFDRESTLSSNKGRSNILSMLMPSPAFGILIPFAVMFVIFLSYQQHFSKNTNVVTVPKTLSYETISREGNGDNNSLSTKYTSNIVVPTTASGIRKHSEIISTLDANDKTDPVLEKTIETQRHINIGIVSGSSRGTYASLAEKLTDGLEIHEKLTLRADENNQTGTVASIANVRINDLNTCCEMGIVQADVLEYISKIEKEEQTDKIRYLLTLHNEVVHVIARNDIGSLAVLNSKGGSIAIGSKSSGTYITASKILEEMGVSKERIITSGGDRALEKLSKGEVDAVFHVAGYPADILKNTEGKMRNLHLLDIRRNEFSKIVGDDDKRNMYQPFVIKMHGDENNEYKWLNRNVTTISVENVLFTYNYKNSDCQSVRRISETISDNFNRLSIKYHEKWKAVSLRTSNATVPTGWERFRIEDCKPV